MSFHIYCMDGQRFYDIFINIHVEHTSPEELGLGIVTVQDDCVYEAPVTNDAINDVKDIDDLTTGEETVQIDGFSDGKDGKGQEPIKEDVDGDKDTVEPINLSAIYLLRSPFSDISQNYVKMANS